MCIRDRAGAVPHIFQLFAQGAAHGQIDHGHTGDLGDIRYGTGRTRVDLDDRILKAVRLEGKLAVAAALNAQLLSLIHI